MKQNLPVKVKNVVPGSIAQEAGIEQGDCICSINGEKLQDLFDYRFLITNEELFLEVKKDNNEIWTIEVCKDEYEDLGLEFENPMLDEAKSCANKCIFCFIDQLPSGMRETLYFKDDDSRLSFLTGNYVTLTNVDYDDIDRIIRYRMSPINVSVHTTNPDLREYMLNNRFAGDVYKKIKRFTDGGIKVNCQIVLCRGINDGAEMDRTLSDLCALYPGVNSISVVPVGITKYRKALKPLIPYEEQSSNEVISQVKKWQQDFFEKYGSRIVYLADEFYIMANMEIPGYEEYEDFPQLENGVGMLALFGHQFDGYIDEAVFDTKFKRQISIATSVSASKFIKGYSEQMENRFGNLKIDVYKINNGFFGENVTVTGLLTGGDLLSQLKDLDLGSELLICRCMLRSGEDVFLDDYTVKGLEKELNIKITVVENDGIDFIEKVLGIEGVEQGWQNR